MGKRKRKRKAKRKKREDEEDREMFRDMGQEISQTAKEVLEDRSHIDRPGFGWGNEFVTIGACDGSCESSLHKHFIVFLFDGELAFHCDYEDLFVLSQADDFVELGKQAFTLAEHEEFLEAIIEESKKTGTQVKLVDPREVDDYLDEHPELLDRPGGRAIAIAKVSLMRERRENQAKGAEGDAERG